ncbi:o-succinylbenzoate--CoA ligase [Thermaerobacter litoralis]
MPGRPGTAAAPDAWAWTLLMPDWLHRQAELQPGGLALLVAGDPAPSHGEHPWTFAALDAAATALAERLRAAGIGPGDRVAVLAGNEPGYVVLIHALIRAGAVLVPLNVRLTPAELAWQVADSGAAWLIAGRGYGEAAAAVATAAGAAAATAGPAATAEPMATVGPMATDEPATGQPARSPSPTGQPPRVLALADLAGDLLPPPPAASPQGRAVPAAGEAGSSGSVGVPGSAPPAGTGRGIDLAAPHCIIYTSGTTGRPKGAVLTYGNHFWSAVQSALNLGLHRDDRWLCCVPLFHVSGLSIVFRSVIYGIPMVLHPRFDPAAVNGSIERDRVTVISVVATMLQRMLDERGPRPYPDHLRCVLLGGGPAPRPLLEACAARGIPVVQTYGMTETASQFATLAPADALRKLGSAGKPLFFNRLRIVDERGRDLPPRQVGEIVVQGPTVSPGYHHRPDATARAWRDGWFHTGDLGYVDEEGYLYVADRRHDLIISGGENVYPAEIESVLMAHPAVEEAGVVGVPDPEWGQVPVAVVRLRSPATTGGSTAGPDQGEAAGRASLEEALLRFCAERLARYKVPRRVLFTTQPLPRTASGKLQRHRLRPLVDGAGRPGE